MISRLLKNCMFFYFIFFVITTGFVNAGVNKDGSYSYPFPINIPTGTNNVAPKISLQYNSNSGNGMLGMGWNLTGFPVITRV